MSETSLKPTYHTLIVDISTRGAPLSDIINEERDKLSVKHGGAIVTLHSISMSDTRILVAYEFSSYR